MRAAIRKLLPGRVKDAMRPYLGPLLKYERVVARRQFALSYYKPALAQIDAWASRDTEDSNFYYDLTELNRMHLASLIAAITGAASQKVDALFDELGEDQNLRAHINAGMIEFGYPREMRLAYGRRLGWYALVRLLKPEVVVETGVDHGIGSCVLCAALLRNAADGHPGRYYGTELRRDAGQLLRGRYAEAGRVLYGDSIETLGSFGETIDLFINDSDHSADYEFREYRAIEPKLSKQAVILGDNSHVTDCLCRFAHETGRSFVFFREAPKDHWYPGAGIGIAFDGSRSPGLKV
jgi:predicted O-methyltransferase YrrM